MSIGAIFLKERNSETIGSINKILERQKRCPEQKVGFSTVRDGKVALCGQLFEDAAHSVALSFDGVLYNSKALKSELLSKGCVLSSQPHDGELILRLYELYGVDFLIKLNGSFAFALLDSSNNTMFCARDRLGEKPMVYSQAKPGVYIASKASDLADFTEIDKTPCPEAIALYLLKNLRHVPDPYTMFKGIKRLPAGHAMLVQSGDVKKIWRYWHPNWIPRAVSHEELLSVFDRAVNARIQSDAGIGAMLSGGVDSSAVVSSMILQGRKPDMTFAFGLNADDEDLQRARNIAKFLGVEHKEYYIDPQAQFSHFEKLLDFYGEPLMLMPLLHAYELCMHIKDDGLDAVMNGNGSDEIFYGYNGATRLAMASPFIDIMPPVIARIFSSTKFINPSLREFFCAASNPAGKRKSGIYIEEAKKQRLVSIPNYEQTLSDAVECAMNGFFSDNPPKMYIDEANAIGLFCENTHSSTISAYSSSVMSGLNAHSPFMDFEFVELAWHIDYRQKAGGFGNRRRTKWFLKKALENRLPPDFLYAKKQGFGYNIHEEPFLRKWWKPQVDRTFDNMDSFGGILDIDAIKKLKADFDSQNGVPAMLVAKLFALFYFFQR